ncbi:MAG: type VI secretion system tip protein VgrG, partial [Hymenobacter sp.]
MSYPVKASIQVEGGLLLPDYLQLTVQQPAFTHHAFALDLSVAALAKALGLAVRTLPLQAPAQLIGKTVAISWVGALPADKGRGFKFKGLITQLSLQTSADLVNYYQLRGFSPTYLLEDGTQHRTFLKQTLAAIFSRVLGQYPGNALAYQLQPRHTEALPYVVQYGESNFHFLSRLATQYGEWLYYDGQTLRLGRAAGPALAFRSSGAQQFSLALQVQPGTTQGGLYNYRTHETLATQGAPPQAGHPFSQLAVAKSAELFTQPQRLPTAPHARSQAQLQRTLDGQAAQHAAGQVSLVGQGELFELTPGCELTVQDAAAETYGRFRVLAVHHTLDGDGNYTNHFEALPTTTLVPPPSPYHAALEARSELAEVIDQQDPRRLGRVRVRFQWPVKEAADAESSWLRVSTPYSGNGKGQLFTPEVGSQVLVGYEQGRAEFPVVLGNLFHPQNPQQANYTTDQNHLKGLQTAGGNKVVMLDTKGDQKVLLSNSNNKGTAVEIGFKGDGSITIKSSGPVTVLGSTITLEAGDKGEIKMHAKNITLVAEDDVKVSAKTKGIALDAKDKMALTSKELLA